MSSSKVTGSFQLMKSLNRSLILNTIRQYEQISRADIAKKTKLTPPTVTNIVGELIEVGLVKESEVGESRGGRKPILLTIDPNHSFIIGLDVGGLLVRAVLTDLNANIKTQKTVDLPNELDNESLLMSLTKVIEEIIAEGSVPPDKLLGIGVGMHGIVNHIKGVSVFAPNFKLTDIPIKAHLEHRFQLPTFVENDARALALGEAWFGNGRELDNVICINVGVGIGAGIILNHELFHGQNGIAGEFGHMIVDLNGEKCTCGSYGCLQTIAGGGMLRKRALKEIELGRKTKLTEKMGTNLDKVTGALIHQCALEGDELSAQILEETGRYLGIGVTNLINLFNPTRVIIGGGVSKAGDFVIEPLREVVKQRALTPKARETDIVVSKLGEYGTVIGAVTLVLKDIFSPNLKSR
ncbi:ROK family transcriptional regulator [Halalkalibacter urbisdiaboli]|uniref:ROK family transcriptional regulator n=1 Tax=Halalkalibacter urbisdiaboli TaxID=1960589 RepID=UPI001FD99364|nr:ROK family transcriptional regulator [Halalkalibacter urbisdiaboli]